MKRIFVLIGFLFLCSTAQAKASWNLAIDEHFDNLSTFNQNCTFITGTHGNEQQTYVSGIGNNATLGTNGLTITGKKEIDNSYTSAAIECGTATDNMRVEVIALSPIGQGLWPAIWFPDSYTGTGYGELDLMEILGQAPTTVYSNVWTGDANQDTATQHQTTTTLDTTQYVSYVAELTSETIKYYYNGTLIQTYDRNTVVGVKTPLKQNYKVRINLALGGSWPGNVSDSALPAQFKIRSLKIWQGNGFIDRPNTAAFKGNPNQLLH